MTSDPPVIAAITNASSTMGANGWPPSGGMGLGSRTRTAYRL